MASLFVSDSQLSLAKRTLDVAVILSVSDLLVAEHKEVLDRIKKLFKYAVFVASARYVARQKPERKPPETTELNHHQNHPRDDVKDKEVDYRKRDRCAEQELVQRVKAVPALHKLNES